MPQHYPLKNYLTNIEKADMTEQCLLKVFLQEEEMCLSKLEGSSPIWLIIIEGPALQSDSFIFYKTYKEILTSFTKAISFSQITL
jgi:hypothetical protein